MPMQRRKIIERQQGGAIFVQTLTSFRILCFITEQEVIERLLSRRATLSHPDIVKLRFGFGLQAGW